MKKIILSLSVITLTLFVSPNIFAAPSGGGGGPYNPPPGATAGCGPAVNGNGTFGAPANRQREWPGGSWTPMCTLFGGNSSNYTYISAFSITYSAPWANTPSYNVTTTFNWTCSVAGVGGGTSASCGVGRVSRCGSARGQSFATPPTSNLCAYGSPSSVSTTSSSYNWTCYSASSYSTVGSVSYSDSCSATRLVASCGSSHTKLLMSAPTTNLCNSGTPSAVSTTGATTYNWTCTHSGGTPTACYANKAIMTPQCTDAAYAAADYTSCMNGGTCNCFNTLSTGATSSYTPGTGTYSGAISFRQDTVGNLFLGSPVGAGPFGALVIGYTGPGLVVGAGAVGINTALPGAALDMKGVTRIPNLTGPFLQRLMITSSGHVTTGAGPVSWWAYSGSSIYNLLGGNIGIGTATPSDKLQVIGSIRANAFLINSDERLKYDIEKLEGSLNKISSLHPVSYKWKADNKKDIGLIAQDIEKPFPDLVSTDTQGFKSVKYSNLIAPAIGAIQELSYALHELGMQKLKKQEKEIEQLEKRIERLQKYIQ